jgi:hypothetical protein
MARIHIVVDENEKLRFRTRAEREGKSLSAWLRDAAREKLAEESQVRLETVEELRDFFFACNRRETGTEPDWEQHVRVIKTSKGSGAADA